MITGLPSYLTPIERGVRSVCSRYYVAYIGGGIGEAEARERERAATIKAKFVDARLKPFMNCDCSQVLDFNSSDVCKLVM